MINIKEKDKIVFDGMNGYIVRIYQKVQGGHEKLYEQGHCCIWIDLNGTNIWTTSDKIIVQNHPHTTLFK